MSTRADLLPPNTGVYITAAEQLILHIIIIPTSLAGAGGREGRTELSGSWPVLGGATQKGAPRCGVLGRKEKDEGPVG